MAWFVDWGTDPPSEMELAHHRALREHLEHRGIHMLWSHKKSHMADTLHKALPNKACGSQQILQLHFEDFQQVGHSSLPNAFTISFLLPAPVSTTFYSSPSAGTVDAEMTPPYRPQVSANSPANWEKIRSNLWTRYQLLKCLLLLLFSCWLFAPFALPLETIFLPVPKVMKTGAIRRSWGFSEKNAGILKVVPVVESNLSMPWQWHFAHSQVTEVLLKSLGVSKTDVAPGKQTPQEVPSTLKSATRASHLWPSRSQAERRHALKFWRSCLPSTPWFHWKRHSNQRGAFVDIGRAGAGLVKK